MKSYRNKANSSGRRVIFYRTLPSGRIIEKIKKISDIKAQMSIHAKADLISLT